MKSFKLKTFNKRALVISTLLILTVFLSTIIYFSNTLIDNGIDSFLIIAIPVLVLSVVLLLKKAFVKTFTVTISNTNLVATHKGRVIYSTLLNEIVMFKYIRKENIDTLLFFATNNQQATFSIECVDQRKRFRKIVETINYTGNYTANIQSDEISTIWTDYINKDIVAKEVVIRKKAPQYYRQVPLHQFSN
ncbi:hypothetical protein [Dysgonomonas termitidis]|uniref:DUF304 domain-containing protein n=1 Tax=Dysgonomonas termitidis TaxID=1516126 RepID=A0ABV9L1M3_9BACT